MDPSWQPDPTGRHHYRWWDGAEWGDSVADHGVVSTDPFRTGPPVKVTVSTIPTLGDEPVPATPSGPVAPVYATGPITVGGGIGKWLVLAAVVLLGAGVALYLMVFRSDGGIGPSGIGVSVERVEGEEGSVVRDVRMDDGDAIRYRVEGDGNRDLVTYLMAPDQLATDHMKRTFTDYGEDLGVDSTDDLLSDLTEADDVLTDGALQDSVRQYTILQVSDRCCAGVADTGTFVATVPGTYRIVVVEAEGRDSDVRIIVERYGRQLFSYADITDTLDDDAFFTDSGFFRDTEPFEVDD